MRTDVAGKSENQPLTITKRNKSSRSNIMGISSGYHDSACCLLQDGVLVAAVQEERFSRVKNDRSFPRKALRYCLEAGGISLGDLDCVAYYEDPCLKLGRQIWMSLVPEISSERLQATADRLARRSPQDFIRRFGYDGPVEIVDHHLSHAASAYYFSGFKESAILTIDGVGDWPTTTYGCGNEFEIKRFEQVDFPDSLGFFYSALTGYLGFEVNEGEYKVMGLAPYGRPLYADKIRKLIEVGPKGQYRLDLKYFSFLQEDSMYSEELCSLLGRPPRSPNAELDSFHMDVAKSTQVVLEEVLLEKVRYLHSQVPSENLCMAGGVALNVVANGRCLKEGPFRRQFVQPAAGDAGGAVGAAAVARVRREKGPTPFGKLEHVYLGPANSSLSVRRLLEASSATFQDFSGRTAEMLRYTVQKLTEGKVVGWCQGRMEFGPRALGGRSILADARRPEMRDRINALIKMREAFRPFAPAVLASRTSEHFALDHDSPFMLETCKVISHVSLPSITHVDGSARVQTVDANTNPRFAALLEEFYRATDCPILLNTSFNMRGEPIVCTAFDAMMCFVRSKIDVLVVEDYVLERSGVPPLWEFQAHLAYKKRTSSGAISTNVYTLL